MKYLGNNKFNKGLRQIFNKLAGFLKGVMARLIKVFLLRLRRKNEPPPQKNGGKYYHCNSTHHSFFGRIKCTMEILKEIHRLLKENNKHLKDMRKSAKEQPVEPNGKFSTPERDPGANSLKKPADMEVNGKTTGKENYLKTERKKVPDDTMPHEMSQKYVKDMKIKSNFRLWYIIPLAVVGFVVMAIMINLAIIASEVDLTEYNVPRIFHLHFVAYIPSIIASVLTAMYKWHYLNGGPRYRNGSEK